MVMTSKLRNKIRTQEVDKPKEIQPSPAAHTLLPYKELCPASFTIQFVPCEVFLGTKERKFITDRSNLVYSNLQENCLVSVVSRKKVARFLDFVQMRGEGCGPAQIFCHLFISAFLANKRSLFPPKCQ